MPIHNLNFSKLRTEGNFLNLPKVVLKKPTANNKLNGKMLNNLPLSRNEIKMLTPTITIVALHWRSQTVPQGKEKR